MWQDDDNDRWLAGKSLKSPIICKAIISPYSSGGRTLQGTRVLSSLPDTSWHQRAYVPYVGRWFHFVHFRIRS